jgi:hypothetical protein
VTGGRRKRRRKEGKENKRKSQEKRRENDGGTTREKARANESLINGSSREIGSWRRLTDIRWLLEEALLT